MKKLRRSLLWGIIIILHLSANAQQEYSGAERTYGMKIGSTPPLRDLLPRTPADALKYQELKGSRPEYTRNFIGRRQIPVVKEGTLPVGKDPLMPEGLTRAGEILIEPVVNVEGINQMTSGIGVPDPNGDVSPQYYMQSVNATLLQVFDLAGNKVGNPFSSSMIWQQVGRSACCDHILLYDNQIGRWLLTALANTNHVLLALSDSADPLGSWTAYAFGTPSVPDYPKYGIWPTAYVLTTNEGGGVIKFYTISRQDIIDGADTIDIQSFAIPRLPDPSWQTAQPVDWNGTDVADDTYPMIMRINDDAYGSSPVDQIEIFEIRVNWENEDSSVVQQIEIPLSPYDSEFCSSPGFGFSCIPQPNGQGIDGIPYIFMHASQYRNLGSHSAIVANFTVDVTGDDDAGIRWIELRKTGAGEWELFQEGTVGSDDGLNRFMGSIAIDSDGNIGLGYSVSSESKFPSLRFTGRRASDGAGKMTVREYEFATGTGSRNNERFGDYASMSTDPQDMFWYTGEYIRMNGQWATKIVGFKLERDSIDIGPGALAYPQDSPDLGQENITACVINHGILPLTTFQIGVISPAGLIITEEVTVDTLFTDSIYCHTFSEAIDFTAFGPHEVIVFTSMLLDSNVINDTCRFTVVKQTRWDASIPLAEVPQALCDTFIDVAFVLQNAGAEVLISAEVIWAVNGGDSDTIPWTGSLLMGEQTIIPVQINELAEGDNMIFVYSRLPNGNADQDMRNDTLHLVVHVTPGGQRTILNLTTDEYPDETTWQVLNEAGDVILQGGPFFMSQTTFTEEWCLDTSQCYKFVLLDNFGDGIEYGGIAGDFEIINGEGIVVAALIDPDFGFSDTTSFCLQSNCALLANVFVRHESRPDGQNGTVSVFASGGIPPMQYSLNGGNSFQSSSFFNNLTPGEYLLVVRDATGCIFTRPVNVLGCDMQIMAEVTEASGEEVADGSVILSVVGGNGPVEYSINGGMSFQPDPVFINLLPDTFRIVVRDSVDCEVETEVVVDFSSAVKTTYSGSLIKVFPNPSNGYFQFEVEGLPGTIQLNYDILGGDGRHIRSGTAFNYSGILKGSFSVLNKPSGDYYLRFRHRRLDRMIHVVKL